MNARTQYAGPRPRRGFTIVELLVAMTLMSVGLLALAATSAGVLRMMTIGRQRTVAAQVVANRVETLRNTPCSSMSTASGAATTRGMTEAWVVSTLTSKTYAVAETVSYTASRGVRKKIGVQSVRACP